MKKYKTLIPIVMAVLMLLSWHMLISGKAEMKSQYDNYLNTARKWAKDGITKYAIPYYEKAISVKSSPGIYKEVAEYYKSQICEKDKSRKNADNYLEWCERYLEEYPREADAYERMAEICLQDEDYNSCYRFLDTAKKRQVKSAVLDKISKDLMYVYRLDGKSFSDVGVFSNGLCAVKSKDAWGFIDRFGVIKVPTKFVSVGAYTRSGIASIVDSKGTAYFVDREGDKIRVSKKAYKRFGLPANNIIAAEGEDGKYEYVSADFETLFGKYDYASTMNCGAAAVRTGNMWQLINSSGKAVSSKKYTDVILDEKEIAFRNNRAFVEIDKNKYILVDDKGNRVGNLEFQDADLFADNSFAAVKINDKWKFINKDGKLISNKAYEGAKSFSNGFAAVCINGKWGFIDTTENVVIEPEFSDAKYFSEKGSCFVCVEDKWQLLMIYRLNRK